MKPSQEIQDLYQGALKGLIRPLQEEINKLKSEKQHSGLEARIINLELAVESMNCLKKELDSITSILSESDSVASKKDFVLIVDSKTKKRWDIPCGSYDLSEYDYEKCLLVFTTESALIEVKLTYENPSFEKVRQEYQERWFAIIEAIKSNRSSELENLFKTKCLKATVKKTSLADLLR